MALEFAFLNDGRTMDPSPAHCTEVATHIELAQHVSAFVRLSIVQGVQIYLQLVLHKKAQESKELYAMREQLFFTA